MENNTSGVLEATVAKFKLIARDTLRMNLISARLSTVASLEGEVKATTDCKTRIEHRVKVAQYELSKLDKEHPDFELNKTEYEALLKGLTVDLEEHTKEIERLTKLITEQKEGIAKIESGETKVSLDELNALVEKLTREYAYSKVKTS